MKLTVGSKKEFKMRRFHSYGPVDIDDNYYAPRKELIEKTYTQLIGYNPVKGGHYFTVWAPRQTGKTWIMQQILQRLKKDSRFHVLKINLEILKEEENISEIIGTIAEEIGTGLNLNFTGIKNPKQFQEIFKNSGIKKSFILILDEFDAILEKGINAVVGAFRNIYINRRDEGEKPSGQKTYLLHSVALIGVRSVLGIDSEKGSPFNVQRSVHIPNLTFKEVEAMFKWYERESGQKVEDDVVKTLYEETRGQPGLIGWFGELLTETYNKNKNAPITIKNFKYVYKFATDVLPNNNIINIISKANKEPYREQVLELFKTDGKIEFRFDRKKMNYLYMNGVIDIETIENENEEPETYCKFSNPFVQTRLFNYFSNDIFNQLGLLIHPLDDMKDAVDEKNLYISNIIKRYKVYIKKNREMLFTGVPRRKKDKRIFEAVYHFNLYRYLYDLLKKRGVEVIPEFPTGNGKIDLILKYRERVYALELKSFKEMYDYEQGIKQAAEYGRQMGLSEIVLLVFVELNEDEVKELDQEIEKPGIKVIVIPVGIL